MSVNFTQAVNHARAQAVITAAGSGATLKFYSGAAPANANAAVTGTLLVTLTIAGTLGADLSGILTFGPVTSGTGVATMAAGYARLATSGGVTICDFTSIGLSGADININTTIITTGQAVAITDGTMTEAYP
jgi:hypothetical protein